jgi:ABC-type glutathione transport system ATPase component
MRTTIAALKKDIPRCDNIQSRLLLAIVRETDPRAVRQRRGPQLQRAVGAEVRDRPHGAALPAQQGGERERVALASIIVAAPRVLVLDEPTRGMDPLRKAALARLIRDLAAAGTAVLVATHDGPFAVQAADGVLQMVNGDAVPTGLPPTALLTA